MKKMSAQFSRRSGPVKAGTLTVSRPRVITRVQRRQFYRLPLQSPTAFRVRGETGSTAPIAARLVNLSGTATTAGWNIGSSSINSGVDQLYTF